MTLHEHLLRTKWMDLVGLTFLTKEHHPLAHPQMFKYNWQDTLDTFFVFTPNGP